MTFTGVNNYSLKFTFILFFYQRRALDLKGQIELLCCTKDVVFAGLFLVFCFFFLWKIALTKKLIMCVKKNLHTSLDLLEAFSSRNKLILTTFYSKLFDGYIDEYLSPISLSLMDWLFILLVRKGVSSNRGSVTTKYL